MELLLDPLWTHFGTFLGHLLGQKMSRGTPEASQEIFESPEVPRGTLLSGSWPLLRRGDLVAFSELKGIQKGWKNKVRKGSKGVEEKDPKQNMENAVSI